MKPSPALSVHERIEIGIEAGESHFREFKSALARDGASTSPRDVKAVCRDIAEALVAFANADGGELMVGIEDDGEVSGVHHSPNLIEKLKKAPTEYVHSDAPLAPPLVAEVWFQNQKVLYFSVTPSFDKVHLTSDGRCLQRSDRENKPVSPEAIQGVRKEALSRQYDRQFVDGATTSDLDLDQISTATESIASGYSPEKVLQYLGVAEYGQAGLRFRRAALLLFAKDINKWHPRCAVRIVRVSGKALGVGDEYNVQQDETITGNVFALLQRAWEALRPYLARTRFHDTGLFKESLIYPEQACREALVNAIAHRDYSREGNPSEVYVFDDRMEFKSPGALLSSISVADLRSLRGVHESRNTAVARVLRESGYMREMGEGIARIFRAMRDADLVDPDLLSTRESFAVVLQHKSTFSQQDIEWLEGFREFDLDKNEQRVVLLGKDGRLVSTNQILKVTGFVDIDDFRKLHERMSRKGLLESARPKSTKGQRRDVPRFRVVPPKELDVHFADLIAALSKCGPLNTLSPETIRRLRGSLPSSNPYVDDPAHAMEALGFIDHQRRFLPKAVAFVPSLNRPVEAGPPRLRGVILSRKPARYGFIRSDDGLEYFYHESALPKGVEWNDLKEGLSVTFLAKPSTADRRDAAIDIRL